jgi:hypothetical protein
MKVTRYYHQCGYNTLLESALILVQTHLGRVGQHDFYQEDGEVNEKFHHDMVGCLQSSHARAKAASSWRGVRINES